eukprot:CAMPEP_0114163288 /NCGR_PEP_ID=MMETSP0043_2-20121206/30004_1 /TAXON_ID=464988 /ORGANISM="Hemiselmis andersenii, Strain CCMP644" /LENGTH=96 /DNA_ID=CAMNT_0001259771 /DNA_START=195 /DNA_END=482 /DNA_ORIENTATION=-
MEAAPDGHGALEVPGSPSEGDDGAPSTSNCAPQDGSSSSDTRMNCKLQDRSSSSNSRKRRRLDGSSDDETSTRYASKQRPEIGSQRREGADASDDN